MALQKTTETPYGIVCEYHKVTVTNINWHERLAGIEYASFISADARMEGKQPVVRDTIFIAGEGFDFSYDINVIFQAYTHLKALPLFDGALDV
jgi:hypothetical protein